MPFAEDHRNYTFESLDRLFNKKGHRVEKHQNIPTDEMVKAMGNLVDSMDLMNYDKTDEGCVNCKSGILTKIATANHYHISLHSIHITLFFTVSSKRCFMLRYHHRLVPIL